MHDDGLVTDRLLLEPISLAHSAGMFALWSDPEVCRYSGPIHDYEGNQIPSPVRDTSDSDRIIDFWIRARLDGWGLRWAVRESASGAFVGTTGFNSLGRCAEYAYHLRSDYWHLGLMSEASHAVFDWVRDTGCVELNAFIEPDNIDSIRFALRNGFRNACDKAPGALRFTRSLT